MVLPVVFIDLQSPVDCHLFFLLLLSSISEYENKRENFLSSSEDICMYVCECVCVCVCVCNIHIYASSACQTSGQSRPVRRLSCPLANRASQKDLFVHPRHRPPPPCMTTQWKRRSWKRARDMVIHHVPSSPPSICSCASFSRQET